MQGCALCITKFGTPRPDTCLLYPSGVPGRITGQWIVYGQILLLRIQGLICARHHVVALQLVATFRAMARCSTAFLLCAHHQYLFWTFVHCCLESSPVGSTEHTSLQLNSLYSNREAHAYICIAMTFRSLSPATWLGHQGTG